MSDGEDSGVRVRCVLCLNRPMDGSIKGFQSIPAGPPLSTSAPAGANGCAAHDGLGGPHAHSPQTNPYAAATGRC